MTKYRAILRLRSQGISQRSIAASCECSRNTVAKVLGRAEELGITWPLPESMEDKVLGEELFGAQRAASTRKRPDYEHIHRELSRSGVTLALLWNEYCEACRLEGTLPLMYTQFCFHYRQYAVIHKATLRIEHKPGERMEVDWAGTTMALQDNITGKPIPVYLFVAALSCSGYAYAEGFMTQNQESWIMAHVNAFSYFGGITKMLVPDNLKTGVVGYDWYTPIINKVYHEMAEWSIATVQFNYHIAVGKMNYSVPYEYIKRKVDVRVTKNMVEVFYESSRIASHPRLHGHTGQYSTLPEHMPANHQMYSQWNAERFLSWGRCIGKNTETVVSALLASRQIEQQSYKACMGLLKLADKYSVTRLEAACKRAMSYTATPSLKSIQTILKSGSDKLSDEPNTPDTSASQHAFTRGAGYYGRES